MLERICNYGCGQVAKYQFKNGKWCCSQKWQFCEGIKKKISEKNTGKVRTLEARKKLSQSHLSQKSRKKGKTYEQFYGVEKAKEVKKKSSESHKGKPVNLSEDGRKRKIDWMKNGGSVYINSFNKNPSSQEIDLRKIVLELYVTAKPQYKVLNYSIDIALVEYKISIEYDGWYHFDCQEHVDYHKKRQEEIEGEGWKFLRYNIFQPFPIKEQVERDIQRLKCQLQ